MRRRWTIVERIDRGNAEKGLGNGRASRCRRSGSPRLVRLL